MEQKISVSKEVCDGLWNLKIRNIYLVREDGSDKLVTVAKLSRVTKSVVSGIAAFTTIEDIITVDVPRELPVSPIIVENDAELGKINKKYKDATSLYQFSEADQKAIDVREDDEDNPSRDKFIQNTEAELERLRGSLENLEKKIEANKKLMNIVKYISSPEDQLTVKEPRDNLEKFILEKQAEKKLLRIEKIKLEQQIDLNQKLMAVVKHKSEASYPKKSRHNKWNVSNVGVGVAAAAMAGLLIYKAASGAGDPTVIVDSLKRLTLK